MKRDWLVIATLAALCGVVPFLENPQPPPPHGSPPRASETVARAMPPENYENFPSPPLPTLAELRRMSGEKAGDASYNIQSQGHALLAANDRQELSATWSAEDGALKLESADPKQPWTFAMHGQGRVEKASSEDGRLTFDRGAIDEWFSNDPLGIEHGFDIATPPAREGDGGFAIDLKVSTSLMPQVMEEGRAIHFHDSSGKEALFYRGLVAFDATGRSLPAEMKVDPTANAGTWDLAIHVDDRDALYPLVIDPVLTTSTNILAPSPAGANDNFGYSLAMSGNILAVGIRGAEGPTGEADQGAVDLYRYDEIAKAWKLLRRIRPQDHSGAVYFGNAVDLKGDLLIVGAPEEAAGGLTNSGAAYLFQRDSGGSNQWGQIARLVPGTSQENARFGDAVAIGGGIVAVGSPQRGSVPGSDNGAVFVAFRNPAGDWSAPALLDGHNPGFGDQYGSTLAADGTRLAVGIPYGETPATPADAGVVAVHDFVLGPDGLPVSHTTSLIADPNPISLRRFGDGLDVQGDLLVAGSPRKAGNGAVEGGVLSIFQHDPVVGWLWRAEICAPDAEANDHFGTSASLSGDTLAVSSPGRDSGTVDQCGAVYLFEKGSAGPWVWSFVERVEGAIKEANSGYGYGLSLSGDRLAIGNSWDDLSPVMPDVGTVQAFTRTSTAWREVAAPQIVAPNDGGAVAADSDLTVLDELTRAGHAVAIDRGRAAVGMPGYLSDGIRTGSVMLRTRNAGGEDSWGSEAWIESPVDQADQGFGASVALCGDWLLVGAPHYNIGGVADAGRAYLFHRNAGGWGLYKNLDVPGLPAGAEFGTSVAINSRWAFVGAPGSNHGYVFDRHEGGTDHWDVATILDESAGGGRFGERVTLDGNFAAFSAPQRAGLNTSGKFPQAVPGAGQVKVYQALHVAGEVVWQEVKTLPQAAMDGAFGSPQGNFGEGLALHHGMLMVGEPGHNGGAGRTKVYEINQGAGGNWGEVATLLSPMPHANERLGSSVALGARWLFAGAPGATVNGAPRGCVFTWDRIGLSAVNAQPASRILHSRGDSGDEFGFALACSEGRLIAGAPGMRNDDNEAEAGGHAIYQRQPSGWKSAGSPLGGNAGTGDQLGYSVAIEGEFMIAGAPFDQPGGVLAAGSAHLYRRNAASASGWLLVKILQAGDLDVGANFGFAVDVHGDTIAIGAPGWDNRGAVYVFNRNSGGPDNWGQQKRIDLVTVAANDDFGAAVALHGDLIVAGAPKDDLTGATDGGSVRVFGRHHLGTNNWGFLDQFTKSGSAAFDYFGSAVDICDGRVMVGAPLSDERGDASGAAYVYERSTALSEWVFHDTLAPNNSDPNDRFGSAVALDGELCVAGGYGDNTSAANSGAVWIFRGNGGGTDWQVERKLLAGEFEHASSLDDFRFGAAVAIRGDEVVVGATGYDSGATLNTGALYVFQRNQTYSQGWGLVSTFSGQAAGLAARAGFAVALGEGYMIAGAPEADQAGEPDAGYLLMFSESGTAYLDWARAKFGDVAVANAALQTTLWGPEADADSDGQANALEAFAGTNPASPQVRQPELGIHREAGNGEIPAGDLVFRYRMAKETRGTAGRVTWSRDLQEWQGGEAVEDSEKTIQTRVLRDEGDYFIMEARMAASYLYNERRLFLRLEVQVP